MNISLINFHLSQLMHKLTTVLYTSLSWFLSMCTTCQNRWMKRASSRLFFLDVLLWWAGNSKASPCTCSAIINFALGWLELFLQFFRSSVSCEHCYFALNCFRRSSATCQLALRVHRNAIAYALIIFLRNSACSFPVLRRK